jgi:hypothetical protein
MRRRANPNPAVINIDVDPFEEGWIAHWEGEPLGPEEMASQALARATRIAERAVQSGRFQEVRVFVDGRLKMRVVPPVNHYA